jgi:gliding motility-associated-like protein
MEVGIVPNLVNVITPNADGINDVIDYSALGNKQNLILSVFDRYGGKFSRQINLMVINGTELWEEEGCLPERIGIL